MEANITGVGLAKARIVARDMVVGGLLLALIAMIGMSSSAEAQSGIFTIFRPQTPAEEEPASPYADAQDDHANWIATGAPMMLRPTPQQLDRAPRMVNLPLPPRRPNASVTQQQAAISQQAPTPLPAQPPASSPATEAAEPPAPSIEEEPPQSGEGPNIRQFAALPPSFNRPLPTLAPPPVPEKVTPEQLEMEERSAPEPFFVEKQTDYVNIKCLKPELMAIMERAGKQFGGKPIITSGQRGTGRRGSYHRQCMAADFFIAGVDRSALASWLRRQPDAGGVGTYCHTKSVHLDVGDPRNWWQCGRRFSFAQR